MIHSGLYRIVTAKDLQGPGFVEVAVAVTGLNTTSGWPFLHFTKEEQRDG